MNPILQTLLMASRGHHGLPPTVTAGGPPEPPADAGEPPEPPSPPSGGGDDATVARTAEQQLLQAVHSAQDPQLQQVLSTCLAAIHKYLAMDQKEQHQMMQGKMSPRLMAQSYGR